MDKNSNKTMVPVLRFPGFTGDWEERKLCDISEKVTEKNKNRDFSETLTNSAEYGILSQTEYFDKEISNTINIGGYYVVRSDDFVYNPRISNHAPVGPIKRNNLNRTGVMSPLYYVFRIKDIDHSYLEKYFSTTCWHKFMKLNGDSGARADRFAIKDTIFTEMPIPCPKIDEQQRIGDFFKQLDALITLHQRKMGHLQDRKKALLQQLFPKNGETVPELRFPGFIGDWAERKLGKISDVLDGDRGNNYPNGDDLDEKGHTLFLSAKNVTKNGFMFTTNQYITEEKSNSMGNGKLFLDDIILTSRGSIGHIAWYDETVQQQVPFARINSGMLTLRLKNIVAPCFVAQFLKSPLGKKQIDFISFGSAQPQLTKKDVLNYIVSYPIDINEQLKIGAFLTQLDDSISLQQRKLIHLQEQKTALLQKLFI